MKDGLTKKRRSPKESGQETVVSKKLAVKCLHQDGQGSPPRCRKRADRQSEMWHESHGWSGLEGHLVEFWERVRGEMIEITMQMTFYVYAGGGTQGHMHAGQKLYHRAISPARV